MEAFGQKLNAYFESWLGPRGEFGSPLVILDLQRAPAEAQRCPVNGSPETSTACCWMCKELLISAKWLPAFLAWSKHSQPPPLLPLLP